MLLLLLACTPAPAPKDSTPADSAAGSCGAGGTTWDVGADTLTCPAGGSADLLEAALTDAGLGRDDFGYSTSDWNAFSYIDDTWLLSWFLDAHQDPETAPCVVDQIDADLDAAAASAHPLASMLTAFAAHADVPVAAEPIQADGATLADALTTLTTATGGGDDPASAAALLPDEAQAALVPLVLALAAGVDARHAMDADLDAGGFEKGSTLFKHAGGEWVLPDNLTAPDLSNSDEKKWWEDFYLDEGHGPRTLMDPARQLAFAAADLDCLAGQDLAWSFHTEAGDLVITGTGDDTHDGTVATLLVLDLGGDDTWVDGAGATLDDDNPVSVAIDLGGDDTYTYTKVGDPDDGEGMLVSDDDGRTDYGGYPVSWSRTGRQGSGRYGIGLLIDVGGGTDLYESLRRSQGFGSVGVGALYDDGGDDTYLAESGAQGAGLWGYGLLFDAGGNDRYQNWAFASGFGYVGSGGLLYDGGGDDLHASDPGNDWGGTTIYASAQLSTGQGNNSFTNGAGFGMRGDSYGFWLPGGLGMVRDVSGDDTYTTGVFGDATGYCMGVGVLSDGDGDDSYDGLWYVEGGAAHASMAVLLDGGGNDAYNATYTPYNMSLGAGHDLSVGVLVDEGGDDAYHATTLSLGASNCQGRGVFVDNDGSDVYTADSTYAIGLGNHSSECDDSTGRTFIDSSAVFVDAGGDVDTYVWPAGDTRTPADDTAFGIAWSGEADEHGGAVDGDGESNYHVDPAP